MNMAKKTKKVINVQPLRTKEEIEEMKIGINKRVRVNELVKLKVEDVKGKQAFFIKEGKTRKNRKVNIAMLAGEIERYTHERDSEEYLFPSQKGDNHLSTTQVYRILESA